MTEAMGRLLAVGDGRRDIRVGLSRAEALQIDRSQAGGIPRGGH